MSVVSRIRRSWPLLLAPVVLGACGLGVERVGAPPAAGHPLIVLLHGHGAPGDDLVGLARELSAGAPEASMLVIAAPHGAGGGRTWVPSFRADTREEGILKLEEYIASASAKIWARIDEARRAGVECSDIILAGFSLGGHMAAQVALRAPEDCTVGGLVVIGGGGPTDAKLRSADHSSSTRVLVAHGKRDNVVPFNSGTQLARHFASAGHDVSFLSFDGGHEIAPVVREGLVTFILGGRVGEGVP